MQIETRCIASLAVKAPYSDALGSSLEPRQIFTNNHASNNHNAAPDPHG